MFARAARAAYSALLRLATPVYLARLWWRGRREPPYRAHWNERLGGFAGTPAPGRLWLHAVSLGETRAAAALLDALRQQRPGLALLLTHGTATGRAAGAALLREGDAQAWLPYDTPGAVRRFLRTHRPAAGVVMETEVWPNLLLEARRAGLPLVLANARLSPRSQRRGERYAALLRPALSAFDAVLAQTAADAARLAASGARVVQVMGNLKYDMAPRPELLARGADWHAALVAAGRAVVLAASTREGEETPLLAAWRALPAPRPLLLLVPRHPQRFDEVQALVATAGLRGLRRSSWRELPPAGAAAADVWLGDSIGEMPLYYAAADVALLGGSFAPLGGQNLIEAAACGTPILIGPSTRNFADAARAAVACGAARTIVDADDLVRQVQELLVDDALLQTMGSAGRRFAERHRGATARTMELLSRATR